jgi:hypothetical protein
MNFKVNWGAIVAGAFIALAANIFFFRLSLAMGLDGLYLARPLQPNISLMGAFSKILFASLSFGLGGFCTVRLAGLRGTGTACLHALTSFSVTGVLARILISSTFVPRGSGALAAGSLFFSPEVAWTLCLTFAFASIAAVLGGVWGSKWHGKTTTGTYASEIEAAKGEERRPAA